MDVDVDYDKYDYFKWGNHSNVLLESNKGSLDDNQLSITECLVPLIANVAVRNPSWKLIGGSITAAKKYTFRVIHDGQFIGAIGSGEGRRAGIYTSLFTLQSPRIDNHKGRKTTKDLAVALRTIDKCFVASTPEQTMRKLKEDLSTHALLEAAINKASLGAGTFVYLLEGGYALVGEGVRQHTSDLPADSQTKLAILKLSTDGQYVPGDGYRLDQRSFFVEE
jgi:hypothetical protein